MLNIYENNLKAFVNRYPKYLFSSFSDNNLDGISKKITKKKVLDEEFNLHLKEEDIDILFIYGLSSTSEFDKLKNWAGNKENRHVVLIEEKEKYVFSFLQSLVAKKIINNPSFHIFYKNEKEDLSLFIDKIMSFFPMEKMKILPSIYLSKESLERFDVVKKRILFSHLYFFGCHIDDFFSSELFKNFYENLEIIKNSFYFNNLKNVLVDHISVDKLSTDIPAIICGAGPSLEKDIPIIKKLYDKALIIAGGSALASLSYFKVPFHIGTLIDPNEAENEMMDRATKKHLLLLYSSRTHPKATLKAKAKYLGYFSSFIGGAFARCLESYLKMDNKEKIGEDLSREAFSVTTANIAIAKFLGCKRIYLSGVDLCDINDKHYSKGTLKRDLIKKESRKNFLFPSFSNRNRNVYTNTNFLMESTCISKYAKRNEKDLKIFNCSLNGLGFEGIDNIELKNEIENFKESFFIENSLEKFIKKNFFSTDILKKIDLFKKDLLKSFQKVREYVSIIISEIDFLIEKKSKFFETPSIIFANKDIKKEDAYKHFLSKPFRAIKKEIDLLYKPWINKNDDNKRLFMKKEHYAHFLDEIDKFIQFF